MMFTSIFNSLKIEFKKIHGYTSILIFSLLFIILTIMDNYLVSNLNFSRPSIIAGNFGSSLFLMQIYLIYLASSFISTEFSFGTSKYVFTGVYSINAIIIRKTLLIVLYSCILPLLNFVIGLIILSITSSKVTEISSVFLDLFHLVVVYLLYFFFVISLALIFTSIFLNRLYTIILTYTFLIIFGDIATQVLKEDNSILSDIISLLPFQLANNGFNHLTYSIGTMVILLGYSLFMYVIGLFILNKRDLT